jgi:hypothetical protein
MMLENRLPFYIQVITDTAIELWISRSREISVYPHR